MDIAKSLAEAASAARRGALPEAESLCRSILGAAPRQLHALTLLGDILIRSGRESEALAVYERAAAFHPGQAFLFTRLAIWRFRKALGPPLRPRPPALEGAGRIQMRSLGSNGRFGNQLLQYAFVRLYAQERGLVAELPDWIGRDIFDFDDPVPSGQCPPLNETETDLFGSLNGRTGESFAGKDINGYFCGNTIEWGGRTERFRALFAPGSKVSGLLNGGLRRLRSVGRTLVALHLRRGDFGYGRFWIAPPSWYLRWLRQIWPKLDRPVLYVATEDQQLLREFAEFSPWDAARLNVAIPGAEFLVDHYVLRHADRLAISNSTFSFSAAMLNAKAREFLRPDPNRRELVAFDPWASPVLLDPVARSEPADPAEPAALAKLFSDSDDVLHIGQFCSPWTNAARAANANLRIREAEAGESVDAWRARNGIRHLQHLVVEEAGRLAEVIGGAEQTLRHARVDMLHFRLAAPLPLAEIAPALARYGYAMFGAADGALRHIAAGETAVPGRYIVIQERLLQSAAGTKRGSLDLPLLCRKHGLTVRGVVHIGAHEGSEIAAYDALHAERTLFVEANPLVFARLQAAMRGRPDVTTVNRAIADRIGKMQFHLASFDQSSSLLPLAGHREVYPDIVPGGTIEVDATTLDALMEELGFASSGFNLLSADVQGAEAMVLRGASDTLRHIEAINIEVNFSELYRGCAQIEDIDDLLEGFGFRRVATLSAFHPSWGDAFYIRQA